ncbi:MAG: tRNA (adenosine(37)-N6)-dimethylallyltransferase MiaA [Patescibacteria group bacterium]|jgi:tRNA dimethylallyltransferase
MLVVSGPTASGKSSWALRLAQRVRGAIIAADSRTVYRELSIGAGKVTTEYPADRFDTADGPMYVIDGVPHYGLDLATLDEVYTVAQFQSYVRTLVPELQQAGYVPMLVGGSGLYIDAVRHGFVFPESTPPPSTWKTRLLEDLVEELRTLDPYSASNLDLRNRRRVERALAYVHATGKSFCVAQQREGGYDHQLFVVDRPREELYARIDQRVDERMAAGMLEEVRALVQGGWSERLLGLGLEYRVLTAFLEGAIPTQAEAVQQLKYAIHAFARRQLTWWRRQPDVRWVSSYTALERQVLND